ncbi:hypothetical protein DH2020_030235 [Rehmannia glutinosa]|uniref:Glycosyltransferase N-terminal domain-containing protein n=1 Tax=Rehmannia glutinosa TaxID=99300 RepID=A0ABR0VLD3_REHGL
MDTSKRSIRVLMFPWLAHGHISPFLELAKSLAKRNFITYICSSPINLNTIRKTLSPKHSISIKLVELHIPTTPQLPPHYHTTNGLPPHLMGPLKRALDMARPTFSTILKTLKPDLVIYDFLQPWAPEEAAAQNIPAVVFLSTGAAASSLIMHDWFEPRSEYPFSESIYFRENEYSIRSRLVKSTGTDTNDHIRVRDCVSKSNDVVLIKTFKELEDRRSTIFASFGSEYFLSENEIEQIACGLELSEVNFVWALRFPIGENINIHEKLPLGFLERVGERGMVVEGWAPQRRILSHPSVGGFLSHCGWSSVMEGIYWASCVVAADEFGPGQMRGWWRRWGGGRW